MRILVVAASPWVRAGIEALLRAEPEFQVLAPVSAAPTAAGLQTLLDEAETLRPELLLIDLESVEAETLPTLAALVQTGVAVVVLLPIGAGHPSTGWMAEGLRCGLRALLPRDLAPSALISALQAAAQGLSVVPADEVGTLVAAPAVRDTALAPTLAPLIAEEPLTARERQILRRLAEGDGNKQIAAGLGISEHTVKFHVTSILGKLHAGTRTEAVAMAIRRGLIPL